MKMANARAKKIIYDNGCIDGRQYKVDLDRIIEDVKKGLFTGIGMCDKGDGQETGCYARKCQVESRMVACIPPLYQKLKLTGNSMFDLLDYVSCSYIENPH